MSFLDTYSGTVPVKIDKKYVVNIKKFLSNSDYRAAQESLVKEQAVDSTGIKATVDTAAYTRTLVKKSIVSWNFDAEDGTILPINDATLDDLPQVVFNKVYAAIEVQNEERSPAEQANFTP